MLSQKGGWEPGLVTRFLQHCSGWVWDGQAALPPHLGQSRGVVLGAASTNQTCGKVGLIAIGLQDVSGRSGAVHHPHLENFLPLPIHGDVSKPPLSLSVTFPTVPGQHLCPSA